MEVQAGLKPCVGCGAIVPDVEGPTHRYIGASPGCWAAYGRLSEREASDFRYMRHHQLTVDAYCVQHPREPSPQSIRSVAVHLVGLHLQLERETPTEGLYAARQRIASLGKEGKLFLAWLDPPKFLGGATVLWALEAEDAEGYGKVARVWEAWSAYHDLVRLWAAR
ncbi:MAG TPA: DUF5946 family protein [Rubrobacter sp.]